MRRAELLRRMYERMYRAYGAQGWWPARTPFEVAVGAILTQNTNWGNVERAIENLRQARVLGARAMHALPQGELAELIRPAGYFNVKARRLGAFLDYLMSRHGGSMSRMGRVETVALREQLLQVHGVGRETADSILLYALGKPVFVVDAYTKRVMSRHGVMEHDADYEEYRGMFEAALGPEVEVYNEYHALLVQVGKSVCRPRSPKCSQCPLEGMGG